MPVKRYIITGFNNYYFEGKTLYRKAYKTKSKTCKWQYRSKRIINQSVKGDIKGYWLVKKGKRKFYPLQKLKHKLKQWS